MREWRATRPVDVARLNSGVFLAVFRKFGVLFAFLVPAYLFAAVLLGEHHSPTLTPGHSLGVAVPLLLGGLVGHLLLGILGMTFIVAVGSLIWWRHVLAIGRPSALLASLLSATRRLVSRFERRIDPALVATHVRREHSTLAASVHHLLDELRVALLTAPDAPPLRLALLADRSVRLDQLTSRRVA